MFGFRVRGAGYRPHFESTCIRRCPDGWRYGRAIGWVQLSDKPNPSPQPQGEH